MKVLSVILDIALIICLVYLLVGVIAADVVIAPWMFGVGLAVFLVWAIVALIRHILE